MSRSAVLLLVAAIATVTIIVVSVSQIGDGGSGVTEAPPSTHGSAEEGGDSAPPAVTLEPVVTGLSQPIYVAAPPGDARLFIVEREGRVLVHQDGALRDAPFLDLRDRVSTGAERGLLSLAFHPSFATNGRFFVNYTDRAGDTRVVEFRARADGSEADPDSAETILTVRQPFANHNGGQVQVGPDDLLYVGMGDGGGAGDPEDNAQDDGSLLGKLLRRGLGTSPAGWQTFAEGLRNPWRFSFDRATGDLWIADVGQDAVEEVDRLPAQAAAGANFGWPAYEGTRVYRQEVADRLDRGALEWPVTEYGHEEGRSITGGYVYRGEALPSLQGWYVFGDYVSGRVWAFDPTRGERVALEGADGQVDQLVSFGEDSSGELYLVSLAGTVFKLVPAP